MLKCYSHILHSSSAVEIDTQAELLQQASLLKCLQLRSQAVEARLRNEINLVCTGHCFIICIYYCWVVVLVYAIVMPVFVVRKS
jgi:hypothetical protein